MTVTDLDGLRTYAWLPPAGVTGSRPRSVLVTRTPYDAGLLAAEARGWGTHGHALVAQDVRGRYGSAGDFVPYAGEGRDGLALLRWVRATWPGVPVVLLGTSYGAHCALRTCAAARVAGDPGPDGVAVAVPALGLAQTARTTGGVLHLESRLGWWGEHAHRRRPRPVPARQLRRWADLDPDALATHPDLPSWSRVVTAHRPDADADLARDAAAQRCPLLVVGGTLDWFAGDAVTLHRAWGGPADLVLGPWDHGLAGAHRARRTLAWLDALVAGRVGAGTRTTAVGLGGPASPATSAAVTGPGEGRARLPMAGGTLVVDPADPHPSPPAGTATLAAGVLDRADCLVRPLPDLLPASTASTVSPWATRARVRLVAPDAEPGAPWTAAVVARMPGGDVELARGAVHGSAGGAVVDLGPLLAPPPGAAPLALVVAADSWPRHPRAHPLHASRASRTPVRRHLTALELELCP